MDIETLAGRTPKRITSLNVKTLSKSVLPQKEEASHCVARRHEDFSGAFVAIRAQSYCT
jgi:hypothetical protein